MDDELHRVPLKVRAPKDDILRCSRATEFRRKGYTLGRVENALGSSARERYAHLSQQRVQLRVCEPHVLELILVGCRLYDCLVMLRLQSVHGMLSRRGAVLRYVERLSELHFPLSEVLELCFRELSSQSHRTEFCPGHRSARGGLRRRRARRSIGRHPRAFVRPLVGQRRFELRVRLFSCRRRPRSLHSGHLQRFRLEVRLPDRGTKRPRHFPDRYAGNGSILQFA